jgi:hypothetical protein
VISEYSGINKLDSIKRITFRLQENGLIRILEKKMYGGTTGYDISPIINIKEVYTIKNPLTENCVYHLDTVTVSGSLWSRAFLGGSALTVYTHLDNNPKSVDTLRGNTGKCRNTVIKALKKLGMYGLAKSVNEKSWVRGDASVEDVANKIEAIEADEKRRNNYCEERKARKEKQIRYRQDQLKSGNNLGSM